jgi:hypothetical protein
MQRVCIPIWLFKDLFLYEYSIYEVSAVPESGLFRSGVPNKILLSFLVALMRAKFVADLIVHLIIKMTCHFVF